MEEDTNIQEASIQDLKKYLNDNWKRAAIMTTNSKNCYDMNIEIALKIMT